MPTTRAVGVPVDGALPHGGRIRVRDREQACRGTGGAVVDGAAPGLWGADPAVLLQAELKAVGTTGADAMAVLRPAVAARAVPDPDGREGGPPSEARPRVPLRCDQQS